MKRDMDLIRKILLQIEEGGPNEEGIEIDIPDVELTTVGEHIRLLEEAGLVDGIPVDDMSEAGLMPTRLTWKGHEFIAAARNDGIWKKATDTLKEKAIQLTFDMMQKYLLNLAMHAIGQPSL